MECFSENWFWVLVLVFFIGMHLFGHGAHGGGCGGHDHGDHKTDNVTNNQEPHHHH